MNEFQSKFYGTAAKTSSNGLQSVNPDSNQSPQGIANKYFNFNSQGKKLESPMNDNSSQNGGLVQVGMADRDRKGHNSHDLSNTSEDPNQIRDRTRSREPIYTSGTEDLEDSPKTKDYENQSDEYVF